MKRIIYHGTPIKFDMPIFGIGNKFNDYGLGFYCTEDFDLAAEWACKENEHAFINKYSIDCSKLKILNLNDPQYNILNWISILMRSRKLSDQYRKDFDLELQYLDKYYIDISEYDIVIGWRADDSYFRFPKQFINNEITLPVLDLIFRVGNLGLQFVLISEKAFRSLKFIKEVEAPHGSKERYIERMNAAIGNVKNILRKDKRSLSPRIRDLMYKNA